MKTRRAAVLVVSILLASCGRVGYEARSRAGGIDGAAATDGGRAPRSSGAPDALSNDAGALSSDAGALSSDAGALSSDAGALSSDAGALSSDAGAACRRASPFLSYLDATDLLPSPGYVSISYCSEGLRGPMTISILRQTGVLFAQQTDVVPSTLGTEAVYVGGLNCLRCFARLESDGLREDGPIRDFIGD